MTLIDNVLGKTMEAFKVILRSLKNLNPTKVQVRYREILLRT